MNFKPLSKQEAIASQLFPKGVYDFEIVEGCDKVNRDKAMADVNKAVDKPAQVDHSTGQSAPNLTNWNPGAREAHQRELDFIKRQEHATKA